MLCVGTRPNYVRLGISSAFSNMVNFIIVDIILAGIIFQLTSDLAGLCNFDSALTGVKNYLSPNYSLFFGVGLTCTRRNVFRFLALLRVICLGAVMATNFFIEGEGCEAVRISRERMFVPGVISMSDETTEQIRRLIQLRKGCAGYENGLSYYGELRVDKTCELRRELFANRTIFWGSRYLQRVIKFPRKCRMDVVSQDSYNTLRWRCDGFGVAGCMAAFGSNITKGDAIPETCRAIIMLSDYSGREVSHLCRADTTSFNRTSLLGSPTMVWRATCRVLMGMNLNDSQWVHNLRLLTYFPFDDIIHGTFVAGVAEYAVKTATHEVRHESLIHVTYFFAVGAMIIIIIFLVICNTYLRLGKGLRPVANNELGLYHLLTPGKSLSSSRRTESISITSTNPTGTRYGTVILLQEHNGIVRARIQR